MLKLVEEMRAWEKKLDAGMDYDEKQKAYFDNEYERLKKQIEDERANPPAPPPEPPKITHLDPETVGRPDVHDMNAEIFKYLSRNPPVDPLHVYDLQRPKSHDEWAKNYLDEFRYVPPPTEVKRHKTISPPLSPEAKPATPVTGRTCPKCSSMVRIHWDGSAFCSNPRCDYVREKK